MAKAQAGQAQQAAQSPRKGAEQQRRLGSLKQTPALGQSHWGVGLGEGGAEHSVLPSPALAPIADPRPARQAVLSAQQRAAQEMPHARRRRGKVGGSTSVEGAATTLQRTQAQQASAGSMMKRLLSKTAALGLPDEAGLQVGCSLRCGGDDLIMTVAQGDAN